MNQKATTEHLVSALMTGLGLGTNSIFSVLHVMRLNEITLNRFNFKMEKFENGKVASIAGDDIRIIFRLSERNVVKGFEILSKYSIQPEHMQR